MSRVIQSGCQLTTITQSNYVVQVFCLDLQEGTFILYDGKNFFWRMNFHQKKEVKINWGQMASGRTITNMTYSYIKQYYFVFSDDWSVHILTKQFEYLKKFILDLKYIGHAIFLDHLQMFIIVSKDEINTYEIEFVKDSKSAIGFNKTSFAVNIKAAKLLKESLPWNKFCEFKYHHKNYQKSYCLIYNNHSCLLFDLREVDHVITQHIIKNENIITSATYSPLYNYLIIGHVYGQIDLWSVIPSSPSLSATHTFTGHKRAIQSLTIENGKPYMLFSCSLDSTIKIWNLDTFTAMFSYPINVQQFQSAQFLNHNYFILQQDSDVYFGIITNIIEHLNYHNSQVKSFDKEWLIGSLDQSGDQIERIQIALVNNIILSVNSRETENDSSTEVQKQYVNIFFAPPISQSIVSIHASPYDQNRYFMHFESGEFCQWKIKDGKTLIESVHSFKDLINTQGYPAGQQVSVLKLLNIIPPFYDVETKMWETDLLKAKLQFNLEQYDILSIASTRDQIVYKEILMKLKFIVLVVFHFIQIPQGCKKGTVLFISLNSFNNIYMRMSLHKEEILDLGVSTNHHGDKMLISYSLDGQMKFVSFQNKFSRPEVLKTLLLHQQVNMYFHNSFMILTIQNAFQIFKIKEDCQINTNMTNALSDHETNILFVDIERSKQLILVSSLFTLKIFNFDKTLLMTIQLHLKIDLACFSNQKGDILISIDGGLAISRNILKYLNERPGDPYKGINVTIDEFFSKDLNQILKQKETEQLNKVSTMTKFRSITRSLTKHLSKPLEVVEPVIDKSVDYKKPSTSKSRESKQIQQVQKHQVQRQTMKQQVESPRYEIQDIQFPPIDKRMLIYAIPKFMNRNVTPIQQYIEDRKKKGPIKNRREWTTDKIILKNLTLQQQQK